MVLVSGDLLPRLRCIESDSDIIDLGLGRQGVGEGARSKMKYVNTEEIITVTFRKTKLAGQHPGWDWTQIADWNYSLAVPSIASGKCLLYLQILIVLMIVIPLSLSLDRCLVIEGIACTLVPIVQGTLYHLVQVSDAWPPFDPNRHIS